MSKDCVVLYYYKFLFFKIPIIKFFRRFWHAESFIDKLIQNDRVYTIRCYIDCYYTKRDIVTERRNELKKKVKFYEQ